MLFVNNVSYFHVCSDDFPLPHVCVCVNGSTYPLILVIRCGHQSTQERRWRIMSIATGANFRFGTCDVGLTAALGLWRSSTNFGFLAVDALGECVVDLILI